MNTNLTEILSTDLMNKIKDIHYKDIDKENKIFELLILLKYYDDNKELECIPSMNNIDEYLYRYTCVYNNVILKFALCEEGTYENIREVQLYPFMKESAMKPYDISSDGIIAIYEKV